MVYKLCCRSPSKLGFDINPYNIEVSEYDFFNIFIPETIGKQNLKQWFFDRLKSEIKGEKVHLYSENGSNDISAQVSDTLVLKLQEFGAAHVAPIVYQYLKDETNTQDELEFLKNIK